MISLWRWVVLPSAFCALVLATTTYISNASGLATGVSLHETVSSSKGHGTALPLFALYSMGSQYLTAYGLSAFLSALAVAYFLARWYRQIAVYASKAEE